MRLLTQLLMSLDSKLAVGVDVSMNGCLCYVSAAMSWRLEKGWSQYRRQVFLSHSKWCKMSGLHRCQCVCWGSRHPFSIDRLSFIPLLSGLEATELLWKPVSKPYSAPCCYTSHLLIRCVLLSAQHRFHLLMQIITQSYKIALVWRFHFWNLNLYMDRKIIIMLSPLKENCESLVLILIRQTYTQDVDFSVI